MFLADPIVNVPSAAALYSQVAGLLAGFAFTALMVYLTQTHDQDATVPAPSKEYRQGDERTRAVALSLLATLIALVVVAVLYAILAGGPDASGAAYLGIMVYGLAFALAILAMFHSLTLVAPSSSTHLRDVVNATRLWTVVIGPTVSLALISSAALDVFYHKCGQDCRAFGQLWPTKPFGIGLALTVIFMPLAVSNFVILGRRKASNHRWQAMPAILVVTVALLSAAAAVMLLMQPINYRPPDALVTAILVAAFVLVLLFSALTAAAQPAGGAVEKAVGVILADEGRSQKAEEIAAAAGDESQQGQPTG